MSNRNLSTIFILLVGVQILSAFLFAMISDGFYAVSDGIMFKCSNLLSSGGDDEVVMLIFIVLVFSAVLRSIKVDRKASIGEAIIFMGFLSAGLWIALQSSDCGEFGTTIIRKRDPYLLTFSASSLFSVLIMINLASRR